jgi:surfeit locus 1 family protein
MLQKWKDAGLVWPTVCAMAGVAALVALGTWQLQRKHWKDGLIAKIAARVDAAPVPLARVEELQASGGDIEYLHVVARGRFLNDRERYLYAPAQAGLGWHVYTPLELTPGRVVWVNRGFVPDERKAPADRAEGLLPGEVEVRGLVRAVPQPATFTPNNDVSHNLWYWPDLPAMSASVFAGGAVVQALPFAIELDAKPEPPGGLPRGGVTRIELPNRHLEYAVTWYGLALTLIGVYLAFAAGRLGQGKATR